MGAALCTALGDEVGPLLGPALGLALGDALSPLLGGELGDVGPALGVAL
jgi:hypothetical protein